MLFCDTPGCGVIRQLFVIVKGQRTCLECWKAAGRPRGDDIGQAHEVEVGTRERMTARGSTDRHLVRNGRA